MTILDQQAPAYRRGRTNDYDARMRKPSFLGAGSGAGILVVSLLLASGCGARDYLVSPGVIDAAARLAGAGTPRTRIAVPAVEADGARRPAYLRVSSLKLAEVPVPPPPGSPVRVTAPDSHGRRVAGVTLLAIGAAHLLGMLAGIAYDAWPYDCPSGSVCDRIPVSLFTGPSLGITGLALLIPGIILTAQGYAGRADLPAGRTDIQYVTEPQPAAP